MGRRNNKRIATFQSKVGQKIHEHLPGVLIGLTLKYFGDGTVDNIFEIKGPTNLTMRQLNKIDREEKFDSIDNMIMRRILVNRLDQVRQKKIHKREENVGYLTNEIRVLKHGLLQQEGNAGDVAKLHRLQKKLAKQQSNRQVKVKVVTEEVFVACPKCAKNLSKRGRRAQLCPQCVSRRKRLL